MVCDPPSYVFQRFGERAEKPGVLHPVIPSPAGLRRFGALPGFFPFMGLPGTRWRGCPWNIEYCETTAPLFARPGPTL